MRRALALIAACTGAAGAEPLPAAPVIAPPRPTPSPPVIVEASVGIAADFAGTQAGALGVRLLRRAWSAELALEVATPERHAEADVLRGAATLAGCRHVSLIAACPVVSAGVVHGGGTGIASTTEAVLAVGARLAVELQVTRRIAVRGRFDGRLLVTSSPYTPRGELWLGADVLLRLR